MSSAFKTVQCPQCQHNVASRMARCLYCGATLTTRDAAQARRCPRCAVDLNVVSAQWVLVDSCSTCNGQFYDTGELDRIHMIPDEDRKWIEHHLLPRRSDTETGEPLKCPGCSTPMDAFDVPATESFLIDICPRCKGTWLDKGEAQKLKALLMDRLEPVSIVPVPAVPTPGFSRRRYSANQLATDLAVECIELMVDSMRK
ncbi:MAG: zf-TFIIB domain-containing protein [Candidatus Riflebacteria bacterium]|nr:zf-TFIIB domain-containing protein [Candidatus Riflebacteria bacterium]